MAMAQGQQQQDAKRQLTSISTQRGRNLIRFATLLGTISVDNGRKEDGGSGAAACNDDDEDDASSSCSPSGSSCSSESAAAIDELLDSLPSFDDGGRGDHPIGSTETTDGVEGGTGTPVVIEAIRDNLKQEDAPENNVAAAAVSNNIVIEDYYGSCSKALRSLLISGRRAGKEEGKTETAEGGCSLPSMSLDADDVAHEHYHGGDDDDSEATRKHLEETAARNLGRPMMVRPEDMSDLPTQIQANVCSSFSMLIDARFRAYAMILLRHALASRSSEKLRKESSSDIGIDEVGGSVHTEEINKKLLALLRMEANTSILAIVTAFHAGAGAAAESSPPKIEAGGVHQREGSPTEGEDDTMTVPLVFETVMDVCIPCVSPSTTAGDGSVSSVPTPAEDGSEAASAETVVVTVKIRAPGSIRGVFAKGGDDEESSSLLRGVEVHLDARILLDSMIEEARKVALQAVDNLNSSPAFSSCPSSYACPISAHEEKRAVKHTARPANDNRDEGDRSGTTDTDDGKKPTMASVSCKGVGAGGNTMDEKHDAENATEKRQGSASLSPPLRHATKSVWFAPLPLSPREPCQGPPLKKLKVLTSSIA